MRVWGESSSSRTRVGYRRQNQWQLRITVVNHKGNKGNSGLVACYHDDGGLNRSSEARGTVT